MLHFVMTLSTSWYSACCQDSGSFACEAFSQCSVWFQLLLQRFAVFVVKTLALQVRIMHAVQHPLGCIHKLLRSHVRFTVLPMSPASLDSAMRAEAGSACTLQIAMVHDMFRCSCRRVVALMHERTLQSVTMRTG